MTNNIELFLTEEKAAATKTMRRASRILADPSNNAIVVEYIIDRGDDIRSKKQAELRTKKIMLGNLGPSNDASSLARKVMRKCEFIPDDMLKEVEGIIAEICSKPSLDTSVRHDNDETQAILDPAVIEEAMDESLELLYGSLEEKMSGVQKVISCCHQQKALEHFVKNHQLMSALTRIFGEDSDLPAELSFTIGKLFYAFSTNSTYHETLSSYRVGALAFGVVELEVKRALHRGKMGIPKEDEMILSEFLFREFSFSKRQEQVIFVCLGILINLASDFVVLEKMMKKSLVSLLRSCLHQKSKQSIYMTLCLLRKSTIFDDTANELSSSGCETISRLARLLQISCDTIQREIIVILFNLSFHPKCNKMISKQDIHSTLVKSLQNKSLAGHSLCLMYHLSSTEDNQEKFLSAGISTPLLELVKEMIREGNMNKGLVGVLLNMTLHPIFCEEMIDLHAIPHIISCIEKSPTQEHCQFLFKVARNLSQWTKCIQCKIEQVLFHQDLKALIGLTKDPSTFVQTEEIGLGKDGDESVSNNGISSLYRERHIWDDHIDYLLQSVVQSNNEDILVEQIGILNNLTPYDLPEGTEWIDFLHEYSYEISNLLRNILQNSYHDDIKMEAIIWIGDVCVDEDCSKWMANNGIVQAMSDLWKECYLDEDSDPEMVLQILSAYEQFLNHDQTRFQIIEDEGKTVLLLPLRMKTFF